MAGDGAAIERATAVVVAWNSGGLAVEQLAALEPAFAAGMRMVLLDNGSVDGSFEWMAAFLHDWPHAAHVDLARSDANLGFCAGVNFCVERALAAEPPPDYIWMLNPDARVSDSTARELVRALEESHEGIASPAGDGPVHFAVDAWPRAFWAPDRFWVAHTPPNRAWWPAGRYKGSCAMFDAGLVRRLIERFGEFQDSGFFMDADEWETTLRARALGRGVVLARDAVEDHPGGWRTLAPTRLSEARQYYQSRNLVVAGRRWIPGWKFWPLLGARIVVNCSWFMRMRLKGHKPHERAYFTGLFDGLRGRTGRWSRHPRANR